MGKFTRGNRNKEKLEGRPKRDKEKNNLRGRRAQPQRTQAQENNRLHLDGALDGGLVDLDHRDRVFIFHLA